MDILQAYFPSHVVDYYSSKNAFAALFSGQALAVIGVDSSGCECSESNFQVIRTTYFAGTTSFFRLEHPLNTSNPTTVQHVTTDDAGSGMSSGATAGIIIGVVFFFLLVAGAVFAAVLYRRREGSQAVDLPDWSDKFTLDPDLKPLTEHEMQVIKVRLLRRVHALSSTRPPCTGRSSSQWRSRLPTLSRSRTVVLRSTSTASS